MNKLAQYRFLEKAAISLKLVERVATKRVKRLMRNPKLRFKDPVVQKTIKQAKNIERMLKNK
jgi:hypothetical protein